MISGTDSKDNWENFNKTTLNSWIYVTRFIERDLQVELKLAKHCIFYVSPSGPNW